MLLWLLLLRLLRLLGSGTRRGGAAAGACRLAARQDWRQLGCQADVADVGLAGGARREHDLKQRENVVRHGREQGRIEALEGRSVGGAPQSARRRA